MEIERVPFDLDLPERPMPHRRSHLAVSTLVALATGLATGGQAHAQTSAAEPALPPLEQTTVIGRGGPFPVAPTKALSARERRRLVPRSERRVRVPRKGGPRVRRPGSGSAIARASIDGTHGPYANKLGWILYYADRYWARTLGSRYRTPTLYNDMRSTGVNRCGNDTLTLNNAWACRDPFFITWDNNWFQAYFNWNQGGDASVAAILAHEWGHSVQWLLGIPLRYMLHREKFADCASGAFMADMGRSGRLDNLGIGDAQEAVNAIWVLGDAQPQPLDSAHGSSRDRYDMFVYGGQYGPWACVNWARS
jgi:hypothetical protein